MVLIKPCFPQFVSAAMNSSSVKDKNLGGFRKKLPQKPTQDNAAYLENIQKNGSALVELSLLHLLTGKLANNL